MKHRYQYYHHEQRALLVRDEEHRRDRPHLRWCNWLNISMNLHLRVVRISDHEWVDWAKKRNVWEVDSKKKSTYVFISHGDLCLRIFLLMRIEKRKEKLGMAVCGKIKSSIDEPMRILRTATSRMTGSISVNQSLALSLSRWGQIATANFVVVLFGENNLISKYSMNCLE